MAAIAHPTWTEVQDMTQLERDAINIIKGEANGDTYLWDHVWYDKYGHPHQGQWKSQVDQFAEGDRDE